MSKLWRAVAWLVTRPRVTTWLALRAAKTPYTHITAADNPNNVYMWRWWLFNPYRKDADGNVLPARFPWLPSVRLHKIERPDSDRHLHDHPWDARTIILRGRYVEQRLDATRVRDAGYTGTLKFGEYHRIEAVSRGGVWTLFFTWRKQGTWGFLVDGKKVPYRKYLGR